MGIEYLEFGCSVEETAKSIATLRRMYEHEDDDGNIDQIIIGFEESRFHSVLVPKLREVQELLFGTLHSNRKRTIKSFSVLNVCNDAETNNRCYEFLSQYLEGSQDTIKNFHYAVKGIIPMTVNDATRFASIMSRSNCKLQTLSIVVNNANHFLFTVENTFELIFIAVLDMGIPNLYVDVAITGGNYYKKLIRRACSAGNSKLATNTTLKCLGFTFQNDESDRPFIPFNDDDINPLITVLKTNTGLERIRLDGGIFLSTTAQNNLMNTARDNTTITREYGMQFQGDGSHRKLIATINNQVAMNKFWKNFTTHYKIVGGKNTRNGRNNNNTIINNTENHHEKNHNGDDVVPNKTPTQQEKPKTIELSMYPILLKKLTGKPQFLFQFLKSESSLLFQVVGDLDPLVAITRNDDDNTNDAVE